MSKSSIGLLELADELFVPFQRGERWQPDLKGKASGGRQMKEARGEDEKGSCSFLPVLCKCFVCAVFDNVKLVFLSFVRCQIDYFRCT